MKRAAIFGIIVIMGMALVGLLAIQLYWIRSASTVKEAGFRRSVNDAMVRVVYKLEQFEKRKAAVDNPVAGGLVNVQKHLNYTDFITEKQLDSIISLELNIRGIDTRFYYGIYSPEKTYFLMEKALGYRNELIGRGYAFPLFATDILSAPEYLLIWFPYEKPFLLTELWGMLLVSIILIVVIVYAFSYTISMLFRQKRISDMKTDFINNMTHEFKTPLSTISLACEALMDTDIQITEINPATYISMIRQENQRLAVLSDRILQAALMEKGQLKLHTSRVDLHIIIRDAIKNIRIQVEIKDGVIVTDLRANPSWIEGDAVHLTNLVYNLLDNANKYSQKKPLIRIQTMHNSSGIILSVEDNGIGISKNEQKRIFERLYRISSGNIHNVKGFGLGLSYVKAIVDEHHGKITVESEPDKGSIFTIFLPNKIKD
jgi:two-component system phosphate regulon sensor histidine kinase PhoR